MQSLEMSALPRILCHYTLVKKKINFEKTLIPKPCPIGVRYELDAITG